ncbi:N-acetylglucosaminyldiphosphoundecaprenol N-acetyl-beta-D-mannosaminyltransferase [Rhodococcus sp. PvR044]|jgi:N-acetylglucosaminyldiphosphoundecaprenol N-acetyl-beta-D-mannosaminyltransferase|uniref:WecB/TagA/CpsF family glycosyltransferase n=1 Tax=unclassified Rhodococcus (in: high G+C Gram-positive bacteria) TaxID=192944 RepID=UPI000BC465CA|nr:MULTISPECIES: WecB/TagA/CpsF family glycosyltransferase [unclassified Rhodococcus (in: high G+C Gram-positive bacteria)]PTR42818.1 exopolysaccharide biosynthesis WecB/TagA/CpsF family protein [Rhodococcus sp. OK611]SNX91825.1 polymer biosynthesis protein, WecB/TagA/CpsF family [Rhodococcus sp. OK270]
MDRRPLLDPPVRMMVCGDVVMRYTEDEVVDLVRSRLRRAASSALSIGSVNLDHLHHFRTCGCAPADAADPEWLLLADGMPIARRGNALSGASWPRVTGADLLPRLLGVAEAEGRRVGFFGGTAESHRLLGPVIANRFPGLPVSGLWSPTRAEIDCRSMELAQEIREVETDMLVVSLGKPRQEQWINRYGRHAGAKIMLPFGGATDFLVNVKHRAPQWMESAGLEWFYRLSHEPRRLARRYLIEGPPALVRLRTARILDAHANPG